MKRRKGKGSMIGKYRQRERPGRSVENKGRSLNGEKRKTGERSTRTTGRRDDLNTERKGGRGKQESGKPRKERRRTPQPSNAKKKKRFLKLPARTACKIHISNSPPRGARAKGKKWAARKAVGLTCQVKPGEGKAKSGGILPIP